MTNIKYLKIYELQKRLTDILLSIIGLIVLSPLFLVISLIIKSESDGPIIYSGSRTGLNFIPFNIYKFRTMSHGQENKGFVTAKNDSRVTRFGSKLRKYKLDELPQLVNVLKGEMSLVGPRPEVLLYTSLYNKEEKVILSVRPGITDYSSIFFVQLSDVVGSNTNKNEFENNIKDVLKVKNELRIKYVKERSLKIDTKILLKTLFKLIKISL
jgi:lipopolysaccharide/colanic/teichoic acid biosynthesis glycosyltransferase